MFDKIVRLVGIGFFAFALYLITKEVHRVGLSHIFSLIASTPWWVFALAFGFTAFDYLFLTAYDKLGMIYLNKKPPLSTIMKTAGSAYAISNTTGQAYASGGAVRYLFYTRVGLNRIDIIKLIGFETLTFGLGILAAFVLSVLLLPLIHTLDTYPHLHELYLGTGGVIIAFLVYYFALVRPGRQIKLGGVPIKTPSPKITAMQGFVGLMDAMMVCAVLFIFLDYHMDVHFLSVFAVFAVAMALGVFSQVPGGIGVFEGLFLYLFPHAPPEKGMILASLVLFRITYYFIPFFLSGLYLLGDILISRTRRQPKNIQQ